MSNPQFLIHSEPLLSADKNQPNGICGLDGEGRVALEQLPASVTSGLTFAGTWNANTNTTSNSESLSDGGVAAPPGSALTTGTYYIVNIAGSTSLDGIATWAVGDWAIVEEKDTGGGFVQVWEKISNPSTVVSVAGKTGVVVLDTGDITDLPVSSGTVSNVLGSGAVTNAELATNSVASAQIQSGAVGTDEIATGAVNTDELAAGAVTNAKIGAAAVTNAKIGAAAVVGSGSGALGVNVIQAATIGATELGVDAVTNAKIANNAVDTDELADSAVTTAKLADLSVATGKLADNAVTTTKIADANVTPAKLSIRTVGVSVSPQFPNTITEVASGSNGTLTVGTDAGTGAPTDGNYYNWTGKGGSLQTVRLYVQVPLPGDFLDFGATTLANAIEFRYETGNISNLVNVVNVSVYDSNNSAVNTPTGNTGLVSGTAGTAASQNISWSSGTFTAGEYFTIRIDLACDNTGGAYARVYRMQINYRTQ